MAGSDGTDFPGAANPEACGFCPERLGRVGEMISREIEAGQIPGAVVGVMRGGELAYLEAFGKRVPDGEAAMSTDTVFSIASMTKPMVSAAAMQLVEEGRIALGDPIDLYLPALKDLKVAVETGGGAYDFLPAERSATILDLLRHTSGFTYQKRGATPAHERTPGSSLNAPFKLTREAFLEVLAEAPLLCDPGCMWEYGFSTDVLGLVVETVAGKTLGAVLKERIWDPLQMSETGFALPAEARTRHALPFATDPQTGEASLKLIHAEDSAPNWESGGGGAVSTASDYLRFVEMIRGGGVLGETRILGLKTVEMMTSNQLGADIINNLPEMEPAATGYGFGLGFAVRLEDGGSALYGTEGDFYWSGVYGTYFWCDPAEELSVVFMAAIPTLRRQLYRQLVRATVYQAMVE